MNTVPEPYTVADLLGWRHLKTGKLHLLKTCLAVRFHRADMDEVTISCVRGPGYEFMPRSADPLCPFCFPGGRATDQDVR